MQLLEKKSYYVYRSPKLPVATQLFLSVWRSFVYFFSGSRHLFLFVIITLFFSGYGFDIIAGLIWLDSRINIEYIE